MSQGSGDDAQVGQDHDTQEGNTEVQDSAANFVWKDADAPATTDRTGGSGSHEQGTGEGDSGSGKKSAAHAAFRCPFNWKQVEDIAVVTTTLRAMDECPHAKGGAGLSDTIVRLYPIVIEEMVSAGEWIPGQFNHPPSEDSIRWRVTKPGNGHTVYQRFMQIKAPVKQHLLPWLKGECGPDGSLPPSNEMVVVLNKIKQKLWEQVATPREKMSMKTVPSNWGFPAWVAFQKWGPLADKGGHPAFCEGFEHLRAQRQQSLENTTSAAGHKRKYDGGSNLMPNSTSEVQTSAAASRNAMKLPMRPGRLRGVMPPSASGPSSGPGVIINEVNQHPAFAQQQQFQQAAALMQQMVANQMVGVAQQQQVPPMPAMSAAQQYQMGGMLQNIAQAQAQGMQQHSMSAQPLVIPNEALSRRQVDLKLALESLEREVSTLVTVREATEDDKERADLLEQLRALRETATELRLKAIAVVNNISISTSTSSCGNPMVEVVRDPKDLEMNGKITINITFKPDDMEKRASNDDAQVEGDEGQAEEA